MGRIYTFFCSCITGLIFPSCKDYIPRIVKDLQPLFLIELGTISKYSTEMTDALKTVHGCFPLVQCVVSSSSRRGDFVPWNGDLGRVIKSIILCVTRIEFKPFLQEEFQTFKETFPGGYKLKDKDYNELMHYNPFLLAAIDGLDLEGAAAEVESVVRKAVDGYMSSLRANEFSLIRRSLPSSINMLVHAANNTSLPVEPLLREYKYSWVYAENITYISDNSSERFTLSMNFPTCYTILLGILYENRKSAFFYY